MTTLKRFLLFFIISTTSMNTLATPVSQGEALGHQFSVNQIIQGQGVIWGVTFLSNDSLLFTERQGKLKRLNLSTGNITNISGLPTVFNEGQGGLLDVQVAPDYSQSGWIYFTYSKIVNGKGATTLARAKLTQNKLTDWSDLLVTQASNDTTRHFGSRIAFDDNGHVFFTIGDRGYRPNGQDLTTHAGTIVRLTLDGHTPKDNPFVDNNNALNEIWSYGHRNPQGIAFDTQKQQLWAIEHGPRGGDEINLIEASNNYGWPVVSQGKEYWGPVDVGSTENQPNMTTPVKVYVPSIAPSSLIVYRGTAFPNWQGSLFSGALKERHLNVITLDGNRATENRLLSDLDERIRSVTTGPKGFIYLSTDSGKLLQIRPTK